MEYGFHKMHDERAVFCKCNSSSFIFFRSIFHNFFLEVMTLFVPVGVYDCEGVKKALNNWISISILHKSSLLLAAWAF